MSNRIVRRIKREALDEQRAAEARDAEAFRLMQTEAILRAAGYVPAGDGTWHLPAPAAASASSPDDPGQPAA